MLVGVSVRVFVDVFRVAMKMLVAMDVLVIMGVQMLMLVVALHRGLLFFNRRVATHLPFSFHGRDPN
jgi:hypothetical protein